MFMLLLLLLLLGLLLSLAAEMVASYCVCEWIGATNVILHLVNRVTNLLTSYIRTYNALRQHTTA